MKKLVRSKKAEETFLHGTVIFIILNVVFFAVLFIFVAVKGTSAPVYEQAYAKQIALFIDSAKSGTNLTLDLSEPYKIARKNNKFSDLVKIDAEKKQVRVKLADKGEGYSFNYYNGAVIAWGEERFEEKLYIQIV